MVISFRKSVSLKKRQGSKKLYYQSTNWVYLCIMMMYMLKLLPLSLCKSINSE